jgi:mRNA interferase MazF
MRLAMSRLEIVKPMAELIRRANEASPSDRSAFSDYLSTVIVAPMTFKGFAAPFRVAVTHGGTKGMILLDQVRTVDKVRLARKLGAVSTKTLAAALSTLHSVFAE